MTLTNPALSVSIVVYHLNLPVLEKTILHLQQAAEALPNATELFLIDNDPDQNNAAIWETLTKKYHSLNPQVIKSPGNIGYGRGNNLAIEKITTKYHLVLNPDAYLAPDALKNAWDYMENHPKVDLLCPGVYGEDGTQHFVHRKDPTLWDMFLRSLAPQFLKKYFAKRMAEFELQHINWDTEQEMFSPGGCCMFFRTETLKKMGGFDPDYFLYYEDSDIGRKIRHQGGQLRYIPGFSVIHVWARDGHKSFKMRLHLIKSGLIYFWKWGGWW